MLGYFVCVCGIFDGLFLSNFNLFQPKTFYLGIKERLSEHFDCLVVNFIIDICEIRLEAFENARRRARNQNSGRDLP